MVLLAMAWSIADVEHHTFGAGCPFLVNHLLQAANNVLWLVAASMSFDSGDKFLDLIDV